MSKLLSAGFYRLWKSKLFRLMTGLFAGFGVFMRYVIYLSGQETGSSYPLDLNLFSCTLIIGIALAVFTSIFIGTEYNDGTIRNKLIAGHSRSTIYLSNLIVCAVAGLLFCCTYILATILVGVPLFGWFTSSLSYNATLLFLSMTLTIAYAAIFVLLSMVISRRTNAAIVSLLLSFALLFAGSYIKSRLDQPEFFEPVIYMMDGSVKEIEERMPNPGYLTGSKREVYEFLYDFLPGSQSLSLSGMYEPNADLRLGDYSLIQALAFTALGVIIFRKKDLK